MHDTAHHELFTLRDLMRYAVSQFNVSSLSFGHGSDNAWDEAAYLLLHTLHLPLDTLEPFPPALVLPAERQRILELPQRRITDNVPTPAWPGPMTISPRPSQRRRQRARKRTDRTAATI